MGGNCLKDVVTRRYEKDEYFELVNAVTAHMRTFGYFSHFDVIPAYRSKDSFGDMDIIYSTWLTDGQQSLSVEDVRNMFPDSKQISRNTNVISFEHKEFQIDLIHSLKSEYLYGLSYFSYNDCGNLTSKLARRFGLKHGHRGLTLPMRDVDNVFDEIVLTHDHNVFLDFVRLEKKPFHDGFETLEEMFLWVTSSPYFDPKPYAFENLTAVGRIRDKKRTTYNTFLKWLDGKHFDVMHTNPEKTEYLAMVFDFFPDALPDYKDACTRLALQKYVKTKLNGLLVSEWTGLKDKALGMFMKELKKDFRMLPETVVYLTEQQIKDVVMYKFSEYVKCA